MRRILPLTLAFLTLISSVSVSVDRHFCMGQLKSVALFGSVESCHASKAVIPDCPLHAADSDTNDCCDDEHELVELDDDRQTVDAPGLPQFTPALPHPLPVFQFTLHLRPRPNTNFQYYRPPPLVTDVAREWQVFRL